MRKVITAATGALMLAACGGSDGGSGPVAVVSGAGTATPTPTPTPTATPTPTPTATPTPTPTSSSYTRYADLTGDRTFQTACASLVLGSGLPTPQPAAPFGESLALGYTAATGGWSVSGDGVAQSFPASDAVSAPSGQRIYQHSVSGSLQQLALIDPVVAGTTLSYVRSLSLRTDRSAGTTLYSCVFGVPSLAADVPVAAVSYGTVSVTGTAYMTTTSGAVQSYALSGSTGTVSYDATGKAVAIRIHLLGYLQTGTTLATTATDLGTYTGSGTVDAARVRFGGTIDGVDRVSLFSSFTGAFFGGVEVGAAFDVLAADTNAGTRIAAVGTVTAAR